MPTIDEQIAVLKVKLAEAHVEKIASRNKECELRDTITKLEAIRDSGKDENYVTDLTAQFEA